MTGRLLTLVGIALMSGCGGDPAPAPEGAAPEPTPAATAEETESPTGDLRGDPRAGASMYAQYCATCHGAGGKGDGPAATALVPKPADHTDSQYMGSLSDEHLYRVIEKGGAAVGKSPLMTAWAGVITDQQIRDLIAHLRALSGS